MRSAGMEKGTAAMAISVKRLGKTFVAAVDGVDLGRELDDATWSAIHRAYLDHKVLAFRGQDLSPAAYCAFGARFGEVVPHTLRKFWHPENAGIPILSNRTQPGNPHRKSV